jgi:hypothetical protein
MYEARHAGAANPGRDLGNAERLQTRRNESRRSLLLKAQLGVLMEPAAIGDHRG